MKISPLNYCNAKQNINNHTNATFLKPLGYDTVSFSRKLPIFNKGKINHSDVNYENPKLDSKYIVNKEKYPLNSHKKFWEKRMQELNCIPVNSFWNQHFAKDKHKCSWKIHVYVDNIKDLEMLIDTAGKYLSDNDIMWKALSDRKGFDDIPKEERKGITIYPKNYENFRQVAGDLDYIIKMNGLKTSNKSIKGDAELGNSGRLFYRYEFRSKDIKDSCGRSALHPDFSIDIGNRQESKNYKNVYYQGSDERNSVYKQFGIAPNGAEYLSPDMQTSEDPWRGYDISNIKNNPSVKRFPKNNYVKANPDSILYIPAYKNNDGSVKYVTIDLNSKNWKKTIKKLKNSESISVGRHGANINFSEEYMCMSSNHLRIKKHNNDIYILDTSTNGTYVLD